MFKGQACVVSCGLAFLTSFSHFRVRTYLLSIFLGPKDFFLHSSDPDHSFLCVGYTRYDDDDKFPYYSVYLYTNKENDIS